MISVIVRSYNDANIIRRTLSMLLRQRLNEDFEILNFDSGSTDGTREIVAEFPSVIAIPPEDIPYNPARVLNRAVQTAKGDILVFNNSDAIPLNGDYLAVLTAPLRDPKVGAVYGNQLPRPDADPLVRKDYLRAFGDGKIAARWRHMFSMVSSAARRDILCMAPFNPEYQYSEDMEWSWRLKHHYKLHIVYCQEAMVEHSHNYTPAQLEKRFYQEGIANARLWNLQPSLSHSLLALAVELHRDIAFLLDEHLIGAIPAGVRYRVRQRLAEYKGQCDFKRGVHV